MKSHYDQIIIGGGIIGCSIAYQLAKRGCRVAIIEQGEIAWKSSSKAAGMLGAQAEIEQDGPLLQLALKSRKMMKNLAIELEQITGIDIGYVENGMLKMALSDSEISHLENQTIFHQKWDSNVMFMDRKDIHRIEPSVSNHVLAGIWIPQDGQVNASSYTKAMACAAVHYGVDILEYTIFEQLHVVAGRVTGIMTSKGIIGCSNVVFTTGAWTGILANNYGLQLDVYPIKGEAVLVKPRKKIIERTLFSETGIYLCPKKDGHIYIGATSKVNSFSETVTAQGVHSLLHRAIEIIPAIGHAEYVKGIAGSRPQTVDGLPYMGEFPDLEGVYVAAGHYRNGILLAAVTGEWMADKILLTTNESLPFEHELSLIRGN